MLPGQCTGGSRAEPAQEPKAGTTWTVLCMVCVGSLQDLERSLVFWCQEVLVCILNYCSKQ